MRSKDPFGKQIVFSRVALSEVAVLREKIQCRRVQVVKPQSSCNNQRTRELGRWRRKRHCCTGDRVDVKRFPFKAVPIESGTDSNVRSEPLVRHRPCKITRIHRAEAQVVALPMQHLKGKLTFKHFGKPLGNLSNVNGQLVSPALLVKRTSSAYRNQNVRRIAVGEFALAN